MSQLKFKHPGDGRCPYIDVPGGRYFIQSKSAILLDVHVLWFQRLSGGWLRDTGQTDEFKAKKVASELIELGAYLWWERYASGWTFKRDEWRYYLYRAHAYPYHWLLRRGYDEELVMTQGVESYREFVAQCEEYVNERHGQCSLWEV
jgi:hypothetical protein